VIGAIIEASVRNRAAVLLLALALTLAGWWSFRRTPIDAIPDVSDVQVIVQANWPGQDPEVIDDQLTYPLSTAMLSVPNARVVRGFSFFGLSMVYVIFEDGTDLYDARSRVLVALNSASDRLPPGIRPTLGPDATGVGWIYLYTVSDFGPRSRFLRRVLDTNQDGAVSEAELPDDLSAQPLTKLFVDYPLDTPDGCYSALIQAFDRNGDAEINRQEMAAAVAFQGMDLAQLRSLQDWFLRHELTALDGVSEVAAVGGFEQQYQVEVDPEKLRALQVSLPQVIQAVRQANVDSGGRLIEMGETEFMVRGRGRVTSVEDLLSVPVSVDAGAHAPILLEQVANVVLGPAPRRGLTELNGVGEVVSGIVLMRPGADARAVIHRVEERLEALLPGLPAGVEIRPAYDRSVLIERAVSSIQRKLLEEMVIVFGVCMVFLLRPRAALVSVLPLPVGVLAAFIGLYWLGMSANLMSLGGLAIAIGVMVDASVVMVENLAKHRQRDPDADPQDLAIRAATEVGPALFFSLLIITVSFLPVFALQQQEGRLFGPLAWTKTLAIGASSVLAITLIPALLPSIASLRMPSEASHPISRLTMAAYRPILGGALRRPKTVVMSAMFLALTALWPWSQLGSEFLPPLDEGDLLYMPTTPPGISITKARELLQQTDRLIKTHPQVQQVLGKVGRADTATDPAPLTMIESHIQLTPQAQWPPGMTIEQIADELDERVQIPGLTNAWTMPIRARIDMLSTGIKTPVGIKLLGSDLAQLSEVGTQIEAVLAALPETGSVYSERVVGGNYIDVDVRRQDAARYGLSVAEVVDVVRSAIGGVVVGQTVEGLVRTDIAVRMPRELRNDLTALERVPVPTRMGHSVPLAQVADLTIRKGPPAIKSENARRTAWIFIDPTTDDIGGFVRMARERVKRDVRLPEGVSLVWSGQFESMERSAQRLREVGGASLLIIVMLLYLHFRQWASTAMVMAGTLVFAPLGGIWLLWLLDYNLSVAVGVGFLAVMGLAAETGVVMLVYLDQAMASAQQAGQLNSRSQLITAVTSGAVDRLRPKLMTVATTLLGLMPLFLGSEPGSRVMQRIAAPMVGGLFSSLVLTLVVLPALYLMWHQRALPNAGLPEAEPAK
jgi:Cu(I)/Ag(I) efflux system membrane protein CusA/SilA